MSNEGEGYYYSRPGDERQPQGQPQMVYIPMGGGPQMPPIDPLMDKMTPQIAAEYHKVRLRNGHAQARAPELQVLLSGMKEIRSAIESYTIADGDKGSGERPPLEKAFDDVSRMKLQNAYLRLAERAINYADGMFSQLDMKITDEIKKKD